MSDIKMCNAHGGIFSADDAGWGKFTGEIHHMGENEYGAEQEFIEHVTWHFCGACLTNIRKEGKKARQRQYIAELERENNIPALPDGDAR